MVFLAGTVVKSRMIQEYVPGKQVTMCHLISNPTPPMYSKLGLMTARGSLGIMTITPSEASIIAADSASKAANIEIGFVDRFNGSLVISGELSAVDTALKEAMSVLCDMMGFESVPITRT